MSLLLLFGPPAEGAWTVTGSAQVVSPVISGADQPVTATAVGGVAKVNGPTITTIGKKR